jgi:hypothetical protein
LNVDNGVDIVQVKFLLIADNGVDIVQVEFLLIVDSGKDVEILSR